MRQFSRQTRLHPRNKTNSIYPFIANTVLIIVVIGLFVWQFPHIQSFFSKPTTIPTSQVKSKPGGSHSKLIDILPTPSKQNSPDLTAQITKILGNDAEHYGVFISDNQSVVATAINQAKTFYPASISKLPIAVLILRDVDSGKFKLDQTYPLLEEDKTYDTDPLYNVNDGTELTLENYLQYMISQSDNTAMTFLENLLGGYSVVDQRTQDELGLQILFRYPHQGTAQDVGKLLEGIYKGAYLSYNSNELLVQDMIEVLPEFQDRIVAGVADGVEVAHKIGQIVSDNGVTYADAGIVYGTQRDFIIVVMNQDVDQDIATKKIVDITKATFTYFEDS